MIALQGFHQAGAAQHFGIQTFGRQEQDGKVGGVRRRDIALADGLGLHVDARLELACGQFGAFGIGTLLR